MGEEEKKAEEKKVEEGKEGKEEKVPVEKGEEKKDAGGEKRAEEGGGDGEKEDAPPPPPPEEIIMRVYMHCEGCARKVRRSLRGFEGVEKVTTDCRAHKVVVNGTVAAADPLKVLDRVQKKTGRRIELITPIPPKPEKKEEKAEEKPKPEEKKEAPLVIAVVLKAHMHCEACSLEIKKRILKMKGVQSVDPELKASQVTVKGVFDPLKLVEYVYKRTGKHAVIVKVEPVTKQEEKPKDGDDTGKEGKTDGGGADKKEGEDEGEDAKKDGDSTGGDGGEKEGKSVAVSDEWAAATMKSVQSRMNEFYYYYPRYIAEYAYPEYADPPPQIFSDENPNACRVM